MPKGCLQDWMILTDYKLFHLCNMFIKQKDYTLLDEIVLEVRNYDNDRESSPSLLTCSLLYFIYNSCLTDEMKPIYIDLEIANINFLNIREDYFKIMANELKDDTLNNVDNFQKKIWKLINKGLFIYTQDKRYLVEISTVEIEDIIDDLYSLTYFKLEDRDIYGLTISYFFLKDQLTLKGRDEFKAYLYRIYLELLDNENAIFSNLLDFSTFEENEKIESEDDISKKFENMANSIDLVKKG